MNSMLPRLKTGTWLFWLKLSLGLLLVYWLIQSGRLDIASFSNLLSLHNTSSLAAIFAIQVISFTAICARWTVLTRAQNIPVSLSSCIKTGYQGLSIGLLVPGSVGIDGIRILHISRHHKTHKTAGIASVIMDRILGLVGLLILTVAACGFYWLQTGKAGLGPLLFLSGALLLLVMLLLFLMCVVAPKISHRWMNKNTFIEKSLQSFQIYSDHKLAMVVSIFLSIAGHLIYCVAWLIAMNSIGITPSFLGVVAVTSILTIIHTLPITPLGLGVTDAAAESIYSLIDIPAGAEIQMLIRLVAVIILLFMGLSFYKRRKKLDSQKTKLV